jgi:hypothetical protein
MCQKNKINMKKYNKQIIFCGASRGSGEIWDLLRFILYILPITYYIYRNTKSSLINKKI